MVKLSKNISIKAILLITIIMILTTSFSRCKSIFPDEKLTMQRQDYAGNELRTDGYYYIQDLKNNSTQVMFLYRNGILLSARSYATIDLSTVETEMVNLYSVIGKEKPYWGVFTIVKNIIEYEQWVAPTERISLSKRRGYIENDTTFRITEEYYTYNKQTYNVDKVWHFKHFDNKPDSTNVYIK